MPRKSGTSGRPGRPVVLANPGATGVAGGKAGLRALIREAGLDCLVVDAEGAEVAGRARRAVRAGANLVVAAGGDGTVAAAASALLGTQCTLGILPSGNLNHFARDAGIPRDLRQAIGLLHEGAGAVRRVDVGDANGRIFLNNASLGWYPEAVRRRDRMLRDGASKRTATLSATWRALRQPPARRVRLTLDGSPTVQTTPFVFVANNQYDFALPRPGSRARLDGGSLWVYTARRDTRAGLLALGARALLGASAGPTAFTAAGAREVEVNLGTDRALVALDGEVHDLRLPVRVRVRPRALRIRVPRGAP